MRGLKPCPKCGGQNLWRKAFQYMPMVTKWAICCEDCGHTGPERLYIMYAEEAWNEAAGGEDDAQNPEALPSLRR